MSGSNPLFSVDETFGDDLFGDRETAELNDALTEIGDTIDEVDEPVEDIADEVVDEADEGLDDLAEDAGGDIDEADEGIDDIADDVADAADDADEGVDDVAQDVEDAADEADGQIDDLADDVRDEVEGEEDVAAGGAGGGAAGGGAAVGGGASGGTTAEPAVETAAALILPANNSGVLGFAFATLDGNELTVNVVAANATPGEVHPLHLHGFADGRTERLPVAADDADGDGVGETPEGEGAAFGPVIAGLTTTGEAQQFLEVSPDHPKADATGKIVFSQTYTLDEGEADDAAILDLLQDRLGGRVVELHGVNVPESLGAGTPNEANGTAGYSPQVPVAAGQLLALPALGADGALADLDPAALVDEINAFFAALAPHTLKPDGTGPQAPDPFLAEDGTAQVTTADDEGPEVYTALLLPANNSGVFGAASIAFDEAAGTISVDLDLAGLEPLAKHATHIHGFTDDRASVIPNLQVDADRDGFLEDPEAAPLIGPVLFGVTEDGSISDAALTANYEEADQEGRVSLSQTYDFDLSNADQAAIFKELSERMEGRVLQVHGLTTPATEGDGTRGEVDGTAGYKPLLAVANGVILDADAPGGAFGAALGAAVQAGLDEGDVDFATLLQSVQPAAETLIG